MQDAHVGLGGLELIRREDIAVAQAQVVLLVEKALALHAGHIQHVQLRHYGLERRRLHVGDAGLFEILVLHVARELELLRGDEHEADARAAAHSGDERVHRAAELQVAAQADRQVVQPTLFAVDGHEVGQRLRGVVVAAVARVDDRDLRVHGSDQRRALLGMAHGDDVAVAADDAHGVRDGLALGGGRALRRGDAEHLAAEREHRALEAQARARGRLEKQRGEDLPVALVGILLGVLHDRAGGVDELHDLLRGQLHNVDQMLHITPGFLPGSSSRRRGFRGRPAAARRRPR